jgi:hypothetical protein
MRAGNLRGKVYISGTSIVVPFEARPLGRRRPTDDDEDD